MSKNSDSSKEKLLEQAENEEEGLRSYDNNDFGE